MTQPKKKPVKPSAKLTSSNEETKTLYEKVRAIETALFQGVIEGVVLTCYENERPLRGLASALDWRFNGALSHALRLGALTGKKGELVYIPVQSGKQAFHFVLLGGGLLSNLEPTTRPELTRGLFESAVPKLQKLTGGSRTLKLGLSAWDLGYGSTDALNEITNESKTELTLFD